MKVAYSSPKASVIVLNWRRAKETIDCLDSLDSLDWPNLSIIAVDNASGDDSTEVIEAWYRSRATEVAGTPLVRSFEGHNGSRSYHLIRSPGNLGYAGGNNLGLDFGFNHENSRYSWILNNDTVVHPQVEADPSIGMCGSTLVYEGERAKIQALAGAGYNKWTARAKHLGAFLHVDSGPWDVAKIESELHYVSGAAVLVTEVFYRDVGPMDSEYFLYYEEIDWALRNRGRHRLAWEPQSVVYHKEGSSIGTRPGGGSDLSVYYMYRSRLRVAFKHHPWTLPSVLASAGFDVVKMLARLDYRGAFAAVRGMWSFVTGSRGHVP